MQNTAEILRAAAERVRQGWTQYALYDSDGVCAVGGVVNARQSGWQMFPGNYSMPTEYLDAIAAAGRLLNLPNRMGKDDPVSRITRWNDGAGQTAENVAQGLEYAALLWEQEQASLQAQSVTTSTAPIPANQE